MMYKFAPLKLASLRGGILLLSLFLFSCSSSLEPFEETQTTAATSKAGVKTALKLDRTWYDSQTTGQTSGQATGQAEGASPKWVANRQGSNAQSLLRKAAVKTAYLTREKMKKVEINSARLESTAQRMSSLEAKFGGLEMSVDRVSMVEEDLKDLIEELEALSAMAPPEVPVKQIDLEEVRPRVITPKRSGQNRFVPPTREEVLAELQQRIVENKIDDKDKALVTGEAGILGIGQSDLVGLHLFSGKSTSGLMDHWQRLAGENPDLFIGMNARIARVSFGVSEGVFYRLKAGPVADAGTAFAICRTLKSRNHGCIVSEFSGAPI